MNQLLRLGRENQLPNPFLPDPKSGEVWLVGAGPGNPGLLTLTAHHLLSQADVVVHDRLGCLEIMELLPPGVERIDVGKMPGCQENNQHQINELLLSLAREGRRVVRLKGGDPFLFGRGKEEELSLKQAGIPVHVLPGVSSALAGPASCGIPVTHRSLSRGVRIWTGMTGDGESPVTSEEGTRVYLMAMGTLPAIVEGLLGEGFSADTPCAIISDATTYRQRRVVGTLGEIVRESRENSMAPPALFVVGDVVRLIDEDVATDTYVVTGTRLPDLARAHLPRAEFLHRPLVSMVPLEGSEKAVSLKMLGEAIKSPWILFNNPWSVSHFMELLLASGRDVRSLTCRLAVVGEEPAALLQQYGLIADQVIVEGDQDQILARLATFMSGRKVTIAVASCYRGALGRNLSRIAEVEFLPVYKVKERSPAPVDWGRCRGVVFTSPRSVERFFRTWPDVSVGMLEAVCVGSSTVDAATKAGFASVKNLTENLPSSIESDSLETAL